MKHVFLSLFVITFLLSNFAQAKEFEWNSDADHSYLNFWTLHLGLSKVHGTFDKANGKIFADENGKLTKIVGIINPASINTKNSKRDDHLRSADFFDIAKFPEVKIESSGFSFDKDGKKVTAKGKVTIKGVTKETTLTGEFLGKTNVNWGQGEIEVIAYTFEGQINRKDF